MIALLIFLATFLPCKPCKAQERTDSIVAKNNRLITSFLDGKIAESEAGRAKFWHRDFSSKSAYEKSVEQNRERLKFITGVRDKRTPFDAPELCATLEHTAVVAQTATHEALAVRWQVFDDFFAEGLLLKPKKQAKQTTVYLSHAGITPEQLLGIEKAGFEPWFRFPDADEQMFIPAIVDRAEEQRMRVSLTNREYVYRSAYQLGRHIIGYEIQETLALVDWLKKTPGMKIRVEGQGDGGLLALYSAAVDVRIDETVVIDYFDCRDRVCDEPLDRNVFGLLQQFGDAEIASLICPRRLTVVTCGIPEFALPENVPWSSRYGGAPGTLKTPNPETVEAEVARAKKLVEPLNADWISYAAQTKKPNPPLTAAATFTDAKERQRRIVAAMQRYTEHLLDVSVHARRDFWKKLDTSSPEKIDRTVEWYRDYFSKNVVGEFEEPLLPLNPRVQLFRDCEKYRVYEVEIPVYEGLSAFGMLLVPKSLDEGARLPAILCQHGLERFCSSHIREFALKSDGPYTSQLCESGYVCFAPQGIFALSHKFRHNQRQLNSLGKNLFAVMTAQYRQYVRFLQSL